MDDREVSTSEAQKHLPELLLEVERGATLVITRNGSQVARITPLQSNGIQQYGEETPEEALARRTAAVEEFMLESERADWARGRVTLEEIREWINEGRA